MNLKVGDYVEVVNPGQTYTVGWCESNPEYFERGNVTYKKAWEHDYHEAKGLKGTIVYKKGDKAIVEYEDGYAFAIDPHGLKKYISFNTGDDLFD